MLSVMTLTEKMIEVLFIHFNVELKMNLLLHEIPLTSFIEGTLRGERMICYTGCFDTFNFVLIKCNKKNHGKLIHPGGYNWEIHTV